MRNPCIQKLLPFPRKAGTFVKRYGIRLRIQKRRTCATPPRFGDDAFEYSTAHPLFTPPHQHRHAPDVREIAMQQ